MMTPQEVASHTFSKATLGGYNMAMVDSFLDALTEDYTALYNDNAILKGKLKVLSNTIEEYGATEESMRKTILAALQLADTMVKEAEKKEEELVHNAEVAAARRINELREKIAAEEYRLQVAQETTASYVSKLRELHESEMNLLHGLSALVPPSVNQEDHTAADIEATMASIVNIYEEPAAQPEPEAAAAFSAEPAAPIYEEQLDSNVTHLFENLKFSKDYEIE